jgi:hypothetical protein
MNHSYFRGLIETTTPNDSNTNNMETKPKSGYDNFSAKTIQDKSQAKDRNIISGKKLTWNTEKTNLSKRVDSTELRKSPYKQVKTPVKNSMDEFDEILQDFDKKYVNNKIHNSNKPTQSNIKSPQKFYLHSENSSYLDSIKNRKPNPKNDLKDMMPIRPNDTLSDILNESFVKKLMMDSIEPSGKLNSRKIGSHLTENFFSENNNNSNYVGVGVVNKKRPESRIHDENNFFNTNAKDTALERAPLNIPTYSKSIIKKSTTRVKDDLLDELFGEESFLARKKSSKPTKTPENKPSHYIPPSKLNNLKYEDIFSSDQYKDKQYNTRRSRYVPAYSNWKNDFELNDTYDNKNKWNQQLIKNPSHVYNPDKEMKQELLTTYMPRFNDSALNDKPKRGKL